MEHGQMINLCKGSIQFFRYLQHYTKSNKDVTNLIDLDQLRDELFKNPEITGEQLLEQLADNMALKKAGWCS
jgi:hypothetical protein